MRHARRFLGAFLERLKVEMLFGVGLLVVVGQLYLHPRLIQQVPALAVVNQAVPIAICMVVYALVGLFQIWSVDTGRCRSIAAFMSMICWTMLFYILVFESPALLATAVVMTVGIFSIVEFFRG